jgi:hypothetical protein
LLRGGEWVAAPADLVAHVAQGGAEVGACVWVVLHAAADVLLLRGRLVQLHIKDRLSVIPTKSTNKGAPTCLRVRQSPHLGRFWVHRVCQQGRHKRRRAAIAVSVCAR